MASPFSNLTGKWEQVFKHLDSGHVGYIEIDDMFKCCRKLFTLLNIPDEQRSDKLLLGSILKEDAIHRRFGSEKNMVTKEEFLEALTHGHLKNPRLNHEMYGRYFRAIFDAIEENNSGFTSFPGFLNYYLIFGDTPAVRQRAKDMYKIMSDSSDGRVSRDKYVNSYVTYVLDPDTCAEDLPLF